MRLDRLRGLAGPLALALLLCWHCSPAEAACSARFEVVTPIDAASSMNFTGISGYSTMPNAKFPAKFNDPTTIVGLKGAMYASAPGDACPTTPKAWAAAAPGLVFASAPSPYVYSPLKVVPEVMYMNILKLPFNITDLAFNVTLGPGKATGDASAELGVTASLAGGYVFSNTTVTGGAKLLPMASTGPFEDGTATAQFSERTVDGQRWLYITLPDFAIRFKSVTAGQFKGSGTFDYDVTGPLVLRTPLGCTRDCGPHGRCKATTAGANTTAACECECGWAPSPYTGACTVPRGYCSIYGGGVAAAVSPLAPAAGLRGTVAGVAPAESVAATGASCPAGFGFSISKQRCEQCAQGFGGPGCNTCSTNEACAAQLGVTTATCASGLTFAERTRAKHYSCALSDPSIATVVGPILAFSCNTTGPDGKPISAAPSSRPSSGLAVDAGQLVGNSPTCRIELRLGDMPPSQTAVCQAWGCHFGSGDASWACDTVVCDCPNGCVSDGQDYMNTFKNVKGEVTLDCDQKSDKCLLNVGSLDIKLEATCSASECIDTAGPILVGERRPRPKNQDWVHPVVAAIPAMVLFIGLAAMGAMMVSVLPYLKASPPPAGAAGDASGKAAGPLGEGRETAPVPLEVDMPAAGDASNAEDGHGPLPIAKEGKRIVQELTWNDLVVKARVPHGAPATAARDFAAAAWAAVTHHGGKGAGQPAAAAAVPPAGDEEAGGIGATTKGTDGGAAAVSASAAQHAVAQQQKPKSRHRGQWKTILHGVSGAVRAKEVCGVLGPSGSGKSTLLSALTGSLSADAAWRLRGRVCVDGIPAGAHTLARITALVPQDDLLLRSLTVEECLLYSAALRLPPSLPPADVHARVSEVMDALKISHVRGSTVWSGAGAAAGVSGGERRRVAIGMELVTDPQVLVLDEPTSGLDSFTALNLLRTLRAVAERGHAVMLSLHQPSPVLFDAMDQVILMADGVVIYAGAPSAAAAGMATLGAPVAPGVSVAEHMLHVVSDPESHSKIVQRAAAARGIALSDGGVAPSNNGATDAASTATGLVTVADGRVGSRAGSRVSFGGNHIVNGGATPAAASSAADLSSAPASRFAPLLRLRRGNARTSSAGGAYGLTPRASMPGGATSAGALAPGRHRSLRRELGVLFWRSLADMLRNPMLTAFHALGGLVLGLLVGIIFYQVELNTTGAQNRLGAIFFGLALLAFTSVTSVDLVQSERHAAAREMRRSYYSPLTYCATKLVLDGVLLRALPAVLFAVPFYFLMGLSPGAGPFFTFMLIFIAFNATVGALALSLAAALDSPGKTVLAMNLVLLVGVLFAGFLANKESIPLPLRWITYLSVFRYAWEAMVINELRSLYLYFTAPNVSITVSMKGTVFLNIIGVKEDMLLPDIGILVAMYAGCAVFLCFIMYWRYGRRRG